MRLIGTAASGEQARTFGDYLLAQGMQSRIDQADDGWEIWIIEEDHLAEATDAYRRFQENPAAPEFAEAAVQAEKQRELDQAEEARRKKARKKIQNMRDRWNAPIWQRTPVTFLLIFLSSVTVALTTDLNSSQKSFLGLPPFGYQIEPVGTWLYYQPIRAVGEDRISFSPVAFDGVRDGQLWRLFTPMFIHFGLIHLIMNMMWMRQLGGAIEFLQGRWRLLWMVLLIAAFSNTCQYMITHFYYGRVALFGGMSGVVYGLFGYIWMQGKFDSESRLHMPPNLVLWMVAWSIFCLSGAFPVANTAHFSGLAMGCSLGILRPALRQMLR